MRHYRNILAIIDISMNGELVVQRALTMAQLYNATLATATIIDYTPGYESGHAPFLTPTQACDALIKQFSGKLDLLLSRCGAAGVESIVAAGDLKSSVADVVQSWQPDLVVVGSHETFGLDQPKSIFGRKAITLPFDVLVTQLAPRKNIGGRLVHTITAAFC